MKEILDFNVSWNIESKGTYFSNIIREIKKKILVSIQEHVSAAIAES